MIYSVLQVVIARKFDTARNEEYETLPNNDRT